MPVRVETDRIHIAGHCSVEEALSLVQLLNGNPWAELDLSGCESLHSAAFQALFAARRPVAAEPADPVLKRHVLPLLVDRGKVV